MTKNHKDLVFVQGEFGRYVHPMIETEDYIQRLKPYDKAKIDIERTHPYLCGTGIVRHLFIKLPAPTDQWNWKSGEAEAAGLWPTDKVSPVLHAFRAFGAE